MATSMIGGTRTPWHLWVIGIVTLLWNAIGAFDYTMTETHSAWYLAQFSKEQLAFVEAVPAWGIAAWALGVWGSLAGSVLLLLRSRLAVTALAVSLAGAAVTMAQNYLVADPSWLDIAGTGGMVFAGIILIVTLGELLYARQQAGAGVLR